MFILPVTPILCGSHSFNTLLLTLVYYPLLDWLRSGRSGDRIPVGARFSAPIQTGPGAHSASCTMGTGSFPGVKSDRGVTLTTHPLLMLWTRKGRAIPLLPLWAVRPVQSLSACTRVHCTFYYPLLLLRVLQLPRSEDRIPVVARFSEPFQTGPGAHPASCTMGTGSFPKVKSGRGVTLTPHTLLVSLVMKE